MQIKHGITVFQMPVIAVNYAPGESWLAARASEPCGVGAENGSGVLTNGWQFRCNTISSEEELSRQF
jgi:hypothetical protein